MGKRDYLVGFFNFGATYTGMVAFSYLSFPFVVLLKSATIIPVLILGKIRGVYVITKTQYFLVTMMTVGLLLFNIDEIKKIEPGNKFGLVIVAVSLLFDGLSSS